MVPFPSEYSTYTATSGPQAPLGAPAAAEPAHGSSHFNDILQNLTTPSANAAGTPSHRSADDQTTPAAVTESAPADGAVPKSSGNAIKTNAATDAGQATTDTTASARQPSKETATASSSPTVVTTLVTPPLTVLTPRPRATWANAVIVTPDQNPPAEKTATAPATDVIAAAVAEAVASGTPAAQAAGQRQPANVNSKSFQPAKATTNAIENAIAPTTLTQTPAAKTAATPNASDAPTAQPVESTDPTASAPLLAAMAAALQAPQPLPVPAQAPGGNTSQPQDPNGVSTTLDAPALAAKAAGQVRSNLVNRAQLGSAVALSQTAGSPSVDVDDDAVDESASTAPMAEAAIAATLRIAAAASVAPAGESKTPAAAPTAASVPPPAINAAAVTTTAATSAPSSKSAVSAVAPGATPASPAARPAMPIAMPDLVGHAVARAVDPIQIETPASMPADVDTSAVMSQIVQAMRVQLLQGGGTAQVTLQPGYLGGVTLNVKVDQDSVTASVVADTPAVREALRTHEPALRDALTSQGLRLDHFDVAAPSETPRKNPGGGNGSTAQDQRQPRQQKRRDPSEPAFEFVA